ncbi:unnamed protein product [Sphenostylis stenocarpa]|uniref:Uncharacterized protein n=1 Tax=Sphenostylis stenocarpa TaxID=92480 RepID=A0AA86T3E0_9FABA|nr:unnamed protein product [Sphenostylis stenocarpa]
MDIEQEEMQFLGLFDIYKESYKIIFLWRKIFSQITLTLILPLTFVLLFNIEESHDLVKKITLDMRDLTGTPGGTVTPEQQNLLYLLSCNWTFFLSKLLFFIFVFIFSPLSTSSVVYTGSSIYTGKEVTFKVLISITRKVWTRLMLTSLCNFIAFFVYDVIAWLVVRPLIFRGRNDCDEIAGVMTILYMAGLVYLPVVWQFAGAVTVLEDSCGYKAMTRSRELTKGKMGVSIIIDLKLKLLFLTVEFLFILVVVNVWKMFSLSSLEKIVI